MYVVLVYDVNRKRVAKVCDFLRIHLNWVQNSVFEGTITESGFEKVKIGLRGIIEEDEDSILIYRMADKKFVDREIIGIEKMPIDNII